MADLLASLEDKYQLPSGLLNAVMKQESGGNVNAVSPKGAQGAFQFMPATAKQYGVDTSDLNSSADGAARMYSDLLKAHNGDLDKALASYNYGQGNVAKHGMDNLPKETQDYIAKVKSNMPTQVNPFDQFDAPKTAQKTAQTANPFDQFDAPAKSTGTGTRFTQAQLDAARNPPSLKQDLQTELDNHPIAAKLAAAGTALSDVYTGGKQLLGMNDAKNKQDIANNKTIADAHPAAAIIGNTALYALGGFAPALNGIKGATAVGAAAGALAPVEGDNIVSDKIKNTLGGVATGFAGGKIAEKIGSIVQNKQAALNVLKSQNATADQGLKAAVDAGYKVPPDYAGAGTGARVLGGLSGKLKTAEQATINNQTITNDLAKQGLGLPKSASLSEAVIDDLKAPHNAVYKEASSLPSGVVGQEVSKSLSTGNEISKDISKSGEQLVNEIKNARDDARAAWKSFNSGMASNPNDLRLQAKASGKLADSLENQLDSLAKNSGNDSLVSRLKDARQNLAKINLYDDALNPETGNIKAAVIGKALTKGKPLDDSALKIAKFNNAFGDLARVPKTMDAAPVTPLDIVGSALTGGAAPIIRLGSRAIVLSKPAQKIMANKNYTASNKLLKALSSRYASSASAGVAAKALAQ